jgi:glycosyltransferase involved in cell wall biosynthesis
MVRYSAPHASIILPVRDSESTIYLSTLSLLAQSVEDIEILVLENGSTDRTVPIIRQLEDPRIRIIDTAGLTLAESLNLGIQASSGDICMRMDGDDISYPHRVRSHLNMHAKLNSVLLIGSNCKYFSSGEVPLARGNMPLGTAHIRWRSLFSSPFIHPSVSFKREPFIRAGYHYPNGFPHCEDYALWSMIVFEADCINIKEPLIAYRLSAGNQNNPEKRSLQLTSHDRVIKNCFQAALGQLVTIEEAHALRSLLVSSEYSRITELSEERIHPLVRILELAFERYCAYYGPDEDVEAEFTAMRSKLIAVVY